MMPWVPGTYLGPYVLVNPVGAGGMGEVWKARDTRGPHRGYQRLKAEYAGRFKRETRAIAALNHPHIVSSTTLVQITWSWSSSKGRP